MVIICEGKRYEITSVENVKGRNMYTEILAKEVHQVAKAMVKMPEEFLIKVSKLAERTDEIVPKVLKAGADVVESQVRENLSGVIGKDPRHRLDQRNSACFSWHLTCKGG